MRNSSLEACGDGREIAERFVEDGDEIGRGVVYGGEGDGAVGGPGGTDFSGQEGEFGGVFEELLKEGVSFGFFFFFSSFFVLGCIIERAEDFYTTHQIRRTRKQRRCCLGARRQDQIRIRIESVF